MKKFFKTIGKIILVWILIPIILVILSIISGGFLSGDLQTSIILWSIPLVPIYFFVRNYFNFKKKDIPTDSFVHKNTENFDDNKEILIEEQKKVSLFKRIMSVKDKEASIIFISFFHTAISYISITICMLIIVFPTTFFLIYQIIQSAPDFPWGIALGLDIIMSPYFALLGQFGLKLTILSWIWILLTILSFFVPYILSIKFINRRFIITNKIRLATLSTLIFLAWQIFITIRILIIEDLNIIESLTFVVTILIQFIILFIINLIFIKEDKKPEQNTNF